MPNHSVRIGALLAVFALFAACNTPPSAPTPATSQPVRPTTDPGPSGQPVEGGRVFVYASAPHQVAAYTRASRFVLYDNGTFALQYARASSDYRVPIRRPMGK